MKQKEAVMQNNPNTANFFNKLYSGTWEINNFSTKWVYEEKSRLEFYQRLAKLDFFDCEGSILDVGCGMGGLFSALPDDGRLEKFGIDFSEKAIEIIKTRIKGEFTVGDVHNLPYENNRFDRIICIETLEHVDSPDALIKEMIRVLKPSGKILITVPHEEHDIAPANWPGGVSLHINQFTPDILRQLLSDNLMVVDFCDVIQGVIQVQARNLGCLPLPHIFTIETTLACDLNCPECAIGGGLIARSKGLMSFDRYKVIADKIRPYAKYVYLHIWGEPMLNPDIFRMIEYTAEFAKTNISTNGMSLTREKAEALILSGVSDIIVSIDGVSQEVYEQYRVGGDVNKALSSLKLLQELNIEHGSRVVISPQFIVFKHNQHEVRQFRDLCKSLGLAASFKPPYIRSDTGIFSYSDFPEMQRPHFPDSNSLRSAMKGCPNVREVFTIHLDGSVVACCHDYVGTTKFGNIFDAEVPDIWNSPDYLRFRQNVMSGHADQFCINNCMTWFLDKSATGQKRNDLYERIVATKQKTLDDISARNSQKSTLKEPSVNGTITSYIRDFHRLDLDDPDNKSFYLNLINNPQVVGLNETALSGKSDQQRVAMILGEYLASVGLYVNQLAGKLLFKCQWDGRESEWFDHRLHLLDPAQWFTDFWTASADNVIKVLPLKGKLLNLCSGDGFYDFYFFSKRAQEITCVEFNDEPFNHAQRLHAAKNINYIKASVLTFDPIESHYDVVVIRGAIEHFRREDQHLIMAKALKALKPGGWFCGDTPARRHDNIKHLSLHEYEWADEKEMRQELGHYFKHIETNSLVSDRATTLFWRCRK